jgi:hypothetical protein
MNTKITFFLLLVLLVILLLFYYIDLESNIIILLGVTIVVLIHNIITKKEHFNNNLKASELDSKIDVLLTIAKALQTRTSGGEPQSSDGTIDGIAFDYSCPIDLSSTYTNVEQKGSAESTYQEQGIDLGVGSSLDGISADKLLESVASGN